MKKIKKYKILKLQKFIQSSLQIVPIAILN